MTMTNFEASEATLKHSNEYMPHKFKYSDGAESVWIENDDDDNSLSSSGKNSNYSKKSSRSSYSSRFKESKDGSLPVDLNASATSCTSTALVAAAASVVAACNSKIAKKEEIISDGNFRTSLKESVSRRMRSRSRTASDRGRSRSHSVAPSKRSPSLHRETKSPSPIAASPSANATVATMDNIVISGNATIATTPTAATTATAASRSRSRSLSRHDAANEKSSSRRGRSCNVSASTSRMRGYSMSTRRSREESKAQLTLLESTTASNLATSKKQKNDVVALEEGTAVLGEESTNKKKSSRSNRLSSSRRHHSSHKDTANKDLPTKDTSKDTNTASERPSRRGRSTSAKTRGRSVSAAKREPRDPEGIKGRAASMVPPTSGSSSGRSRSMSILRNPARSRSSHRKVAPVDIMMTPVHMLPADLMMTHHNNNQDPTIGGHRSVVSVSGRTLRMSASQSTASHHRHHHAYHHHHQPQYSHQPHHSHEDSKRSHAHCTIKPIPILKKNTKHSSSLTYVKSNLNQNHSSSNHSMMSTSDKNLRHSTPPVEFHPSQAYAAFKAKSTLSSTHSLSTLNTSETMLCEEDEREEEEFRRQLEEEYEKDQQCPPHHGHQDVRGNQDHKDRQHDFKHHQQQEEEEEEEEELLETAELSLLLAQNPVQALAEEKKRSKKNPFSRIFKGRGGGKAKV